MLLKEFWAACQRRAKLPEERSVNCLKCSHLSKSSNMTDVVEDSQALLEIAFADLCIDTLSGLQDASILSDPRSIHEANIMHQALTIREHTEPAVFDAFQSPLLYRELRMKTVRPCKWGSFVRGCSRHRALPHWTFHCWLPIRGITPSFPAA